MAHGIFAFSPTEAQLGIPCAQEFGITALEIGEECNQPFAASSYEPSPRNREELLGLDDEAQRRILLTSCTGLLGEFPFFGSMLQGIDIMPQKGINQKHNWRKLPPQ